MKQVELQGYPVEVGDPVWDMWLGWGTVSSLRPGSECPIRAAFAGGYAVYTEAGRPYRQETPRLFWQPVKITPPPKPLRKWVRVGCFAAGGHTPPQMIAVDNERDEARLQEHPLFSRWLTDRIEVKP